MVARLAGLVLEHLLFGGFFGAPKGGGQIKTVLRVPSFCAAPALVCLTCGGMAISFGHSSARRGPDK